MTVRIRPKALSLTIWEVFADEVVIGEVQEGGEIDTPYISQPVADIATQHATRGLAATAVVAVFLAGEDGGDT